MDITRWLEEQECDLLHMIEDWFESKDGKEDRAMIRIPMSPDFGKNAARLHGAQQPCVVCGRPCNNPVWMLHLWDGNHAVTEDEVPTLNPNADLGMYPIGSDCLKKYPELKPYVKKQEK